MKKTFIQLGLAAGLALSPLTAAFAAETVTETLDERRNFATGEEAFNKVCARCHMVINDRQDQSVGPDLSVNEYDLDTITHFVRNGYLAMPAFPKSSIDDVTLAEIAEHIATKVHKGE